jgi:hypothetical protein
LYGISAAELLGFWSFFLISDCQEAGEQIIWQETCNFSFLKRVMDYLVAFGTISQQPPSPLGLLSCAIGG